MLFTSPLPPAALFIKSLLCRAHLYQSSNVKFSIPDLPTNVSTPFTAVLTSIPASRIAFGTLFLFLFLNLNSPPLISILWSSPIQSELSLKNKCLILYSAFPKS